MFLVERLFIILLISLFSWTVILSGCSGNSSKSSNNNNNNNSNSNSNNTSTPPPAPISITTPNGGVYVSNSVTISGPCTNTGSINFTVTGGITGVTSCNGTSYSAPIDITSAPEGSLTIGVAHTDIAGNTATPATVTVIKDSVAPVISAFVVTNSSPTNSTTYNLTSTTNETAANYCILENSTVVANCSWQSGSLPSTFVVSTTNNAKILTAWVKDAAGNISAATNSNSVTLDTTAFPAPTSLSLSTPNSSPSTNQTPVLSIGGVSSGDVVKLFTDSSCGTTAKATGTASASTIQLTSLSLSEGTYTFYTNRTDTLGNVSNCSSAYLAYIVDLTAPSITDVTSSTANGTYKAGGSISIQVAFSEVVTVSGTPQLNMLTGRTGAVATYASGTGSNTLTFTYTVTSGDNSSDLDYSSTGALDLAGGSILDVAGNSLLVPLLPSPGTSGSLSANKNIILDTTAPSSPSGLSLNTPSSSSGNVTTPIIQVSGVVSGDTVKLFSDSNCSTQKASGIAAGTTILLTSSTLSAGTYNFYANSTDPVGNISACSSANVTYQVDLTAATISNVTASSDGYYKADGTFTISITFSKIVNVTGSPVLSLSTTRAGAQATYSSGSGSSTLVFSYTVVSPDTSSDLTYTATNSLSGGTIKDNAENSATLTLPTIGAAGSLSYNQAIVLDTTAPTSPSISINGGAPYTNLTSTTLTLAATGASDMYITNTSGCGSGGTYEVYTTTKNNWVLATANAANTVYAKFKDLAGNETSCVNASITHDSTGPNAPTGLSLGSVPNSTNLTPTLSWTAATDNTGGSGVSYYQVQVYKASDNSVVSGCSWTVSSSGSAMTCSDSSLVQSTQYYMQVRAVDNVGNLGTPATSSNWTSSVGKFVTITYFYNDASTSTDGTSWSNSTLPSNTGWHSITYANGKFVAVATSGVAAYSTDGVTWTSATMPSASSWISVTYGNGKFVAIGQSSTAAAYSTDGISWTAATLPSNVNWQLVTYGGTKFVAVAYNTTNAAYSSDGITWTAANMPSASSWSSVVYGASKFVAVASNATGSAAYSSDGITWTAITLPTTEAGQSIIYGGSKFVTVGNGGHAAYSTDGISWTVSAMSSSASWQAVAYGNGRYIATPWNSSACSYSTDGISWTACTMPYAANWISLVHD